MAGIMVDTALLLEKAQRAVVDGFKNQDTALIAAGESVLSALVVVLKHRKAELPAELAPHIKLILERKE